MSLGFQEDEGMPLPSLCTCHQPHTISQLWKGACIATTSLSSSSQLWFSIADTRGQATKTFLF